MVSVLFKTGLTACYLMIVMNFSAVQSDNFRVDPSASKMMVQVGRSGLFGFAGHDHEVAVPAIAGNVTLDRENLTRSRISLEFDATSMKVTGKGEPAKDVPEVQRVMLSERVLDVERHPKITFSSESIQSGQRSTVASLRIIGQLTLRGVSRRVTVPVRVQLSSDSLTATGTASIQQSDFGIEPVSAGAGTVKVKDEVELQFTIVARRTP